MRWITFLATVAVILAFGHSSLAQKIHTQEFSANRFTPAVGPENYLLVDGALVAGDLVPSLEAMIDYAHRPFVLYPVKKCNDQGEDCEVGDSKVDLVKYQLDMTLAGSLTFINRLQVGLLLPVGYSKGEGYYQPASGYDQEYVDIPGGGKFGVGDLRINGKVRALGEGSEGFMLAGVIFGTVPFGHLSAKGSHLGHDGFTGGLYVVPEFRHKMFRVAANLGGHFKPKRRMLSTVQGSEMIYGVAGSVILTPLLSVLGEVTGSTTFSSQVDENPIEARLAGKLRQSDFVISLGGGLGLVSGVGVPNFRVFAGFAWQPQGLDSDNDGIQENEDSCPTEPEDMDGYLDDDGCPDNDNDGDGIADDSDGCPDQAEDTDGVEDDDGCPDTDNDQDGIPDGYDSCPNEPEDMDGDRDEDGCPDNDTDQDGISDDVDKCPNEAEDTDGFGDEDGCPEVDFDNDGIPDDEDECPDQAEDKDGFEDQDGCPEEESAPARGGRRRR